MKPGLEKAVELYRMRRYDMAMRELERLIAQEPGNARAHSLKGLVLLAGKQTREAIESAETGIRLDPEDYYPHYVLAIVLLNSGGDAEKAEATITEALRINPEEPDCYDLLARLKLQKNRYAEALRLSEKGLSLDPANVDCLNTRARALMGMGKKSEAAAALTEALRNNPEDVSTLAEVGWVRLESGDQKGALEAFREALRVNPEHERAREGIVEALKARNVFFRGFLRYVFWYQRLNPALRWGLLIGIVLLIRLAARVPATRPLVFIYAAFALSTWLIDPIFNLFLRFNRFGKYALTRGQRVASELTAACIIVAVVLAVISIPMHLPDLVAGAAGVFLLVIPVSVTVGLRSTRRGLFWTSLLGTIVLLVVLVCGFLVLPVDVESARIFFIVGIAGAILSGWLSKLAGG